MLAVSSEKYFINFLIGFFKELYYSDFFKELTKDDLNIDITWRTPNEDIKVWQGTREKILALFKEKEIELVVVGLENAGKTTLLTLCQTERVVINVMLVCCRSKVFTS